MLKSCEHPTLLNISHVTFEALISFHNTTVLSKHFGLDDVITIFVLYCIVFHCIVLYATGGTAVGTGLNTKKGFDVAVAREVAKLTGTLWCWW